MPILTGENLGRHEEWEPFFSQKGIHIGQLDMRNVGGLNEAKKISDMADLAMIPMCRAQYRRHRQQLSPRCNGPSR